MKIFVSWSGQRSKAVAELMSDWIKCVIQASRPWISTRDIDRGAIWFSEISDQLKNTSAGIVCLTQDNKDKPWILFETGALAKGLTTNRVCTFLVDLQPSDLEDPLAQFNHTTPERGSMWELVRSLNSCLLEQSLDERILEQVFKTYWPQFESSFAQVLKETKPAKEPIPRAEGEILAEILANTRLLGKRVRDLESRFEHERPVGMPEDMVRASETRQLNRILKLVKAGASDETIVGSLVDYDIPPSFIHQLIARVRADVGSLPTKAP